MSSSYPLGSVLSQAGMNRWTDAGPRLTRLGPGKKLITGYRVEKQEREDGKWALRIHFPEFPNPSEVGPEFMDAFEYVSEEKLLDRFLDLYEGEIADVVTFAETYGGLRLCRHGLPAHHRAPGPPREVRRYPAEVEGEFESDDHIIDLCDKLEWEPVKAWRGYARYARATLALAAEVFRESDFQAPKGQEPRKFWKDITGRTLAEWRSVEYPAGPVSYPWEPEMEIERQMNRWLELGGLQIRPGWDRDSGGYLRLGHNQPVGIMGRVAYQLVLVLCRVEGYAWCHGHNAFFEVAGRRRPAGQRAYCDREECKKASRRHAKRAQRRREREEEAP